MHYRYVPPYLVLRTYLSSLLLLHIGSRSVPKDPRLLFVIEPLTLVSIEPEIYRDRGPTTTDEAATSPPVETHFPSSILDTRSLRTLFSHTQQPSKSRLTAHTLLFFLFPMRAFSVQR